MSQSPSSNRLRKWALKGLIMAAVVAVGFSVLFAGILLFVQHGMIYFPRPYEPIDLTSAKETTWELTFETDEGTQTAYYVYPKTDPEEPPAALWVMFHGNASLALDWLDFLEGYQGERTGFLLVDYPGYGQCKGKASPNSILENSTRAMQLLAEKLGVSVSDLEQNMGVLGLSLGGATALQFAGASDNVESVVLVSTFTSLRAMARRTVPPPFHLLLRHNYDNKARIGELCARDSKPEIYIYHGVDDGLIPSEMGLELKRACEDASFTSLANGDHGNTLWQARTMILETIQALETAQETEN